MKATHIPLLTSTLLALAAPQAQAQSAEDGQTVSPWDRASTQVSAQYGLQARVMANGSNFSFHPASLSRDQPSQSFANLRFRSWVNVGDLQPGGFGLYSQFEFGHLAFGSNGEAPKLNGGASDATGLELRRGFLWLMPNSNTLVKVGVQGWNDRFIERPDFDFKNDLLAIDEYDTAGSMLANSVWDFNVAGVNVIGSFAEDSHYRLGTFLLGAGDRTFSGDGGTVLLAGDYDLEVGEQIWGASLYFLQDNGDYSYGTFAGPMAAYGSSHDLWAGIRANLGQDAWDPSLALIFNQGGTDNPDWDHQGWAARASASGQVSTGKLSLLFAASSGDDGNGDSGEFRTIAQSARDNFGSQGYWGFLPIAFPSGPSDVNDLGVSLQNRGLGLLTFQAAWQLPLNESLSSQFAAGWLQSAEENPVSGQRAMGTEIAAILDWKLRPGFGIQFGSAYLFSGDFYAPSTSGTAEDLYELFFRMQFEF